MGRGNRSPTNQNEDIPVKSAMLLVLLSFACATVAAAFVADRLLSAKVHQAEMRQTIIQASAKLQHARNSPPRIAGTRRDSKFSRANE